MSGPRYNYGGMFTKLVQAGVQSEYRISDHKFRDDTREVKSFNNHVFKSTMDMDALGLGNAGETPLFEKMILSLYRERFGEPLLLTTGTELPFHGAAVSGRVQ